FEILQAIQAEELSMPGHLRKTRVQSRVYLNWNALNRYLGELEAKGLVSDSLRLTREGTQLLQAYHARLRPILEKYWQARSRELLRILYTYQRVLYLVVGPRD